MKNKLLVVFLLILVALASCKDPASPTDTSDDLTKSFFPLETGYKWYYDLYSGNVKSYSIHVQITKQVVRNGKTYFETCDSYDSNNLTYGTQYYRYEKDKLYIIGANFYGLDTTVEHVYYDFSGDVGSSFVYLGNGGARRTTITVKEKGATVKGIDGTTYTDVIVLNFISEVQAGNGWYIDQNYDHLFAKGIGLISFRPQTGYLLELTSYDLKKK